MTSLRIGGARVSSGDRLLLGGVVLVVAVVAVGIAMVLRSSDTSGPRSLGDFEAFARIIEEPNGNRNLVSVAAIEAVVPFPILLPEAVEADTSSVTAYLQPPWRTQPEGVNSTYLEIGFSSDQRALLFVQYAGKMDVLEVLRGDGVTNRPTTYEPLSTVSLPVRGGTASLTELPASRGETLLVLQWDACGHGLALSSLASEFNLDALIRISESVPEACE